MPPRSLHVQPRLRVRPEFVLRMDAELAANEPKKGDFAKFKISKGGARPWLDEHTAKLYAAIEAGDPARIREYCADIANIAMKIEECLGLGAGSVSDVPTTKPTVGAQRASRGDSRQVPPFRTGQWVIQREVCQPLIGRVRSIYQSPCDDGEWLMDVVAYTHSGEKIGRASPACGGPTAFEPSVSCAHYQAIREPAFPLARDFSGCWRHACVPVS